MTTIRPNEPLLFATVFTPAGKLTPCIELHNKSNKMRLGHRDFKLLVICKLITGSLSRVNISEGYDKYIGSQGWKKPQYDTVSDLMHN